MAETPHRVAVVAVPPVTTFDLAIPGFVFGELGPAGRPAYEVRVCAVRPGIIQGLGGLDVVVPHDLGVIAEADTVVVTGIGEREETDTRVLDALREARRRASGSRRSAPARSCWPRPGCWTGAARRPTGRSATSSAGGSLMWTWWATCSSWTMGRY